jgi:hypothetical protein
MSAMVRHLRRPWLAVAILVLLTLQTVAQTPSSSPTSQNVVHFTHADIVIDPHGTPLAAYQVEFVADPSRVTLVGIEGGEHTAFKQPPYYDPKALSGHRVIVAALNTGSDLPREKTRVARLHLRIVGTQQTPPPDMSAKLTVAASAKDEAIGADVTVSEGANP